MSAISPADPDQAARLDLESASRARGRPRRGVLPPDIRSSVHSRLSVLNYSIRDLAANSGFHLSEMSRLLAGERSLTVDEAVHLAAALGWHPVQLLPGAPPLPEIPAFLDISVFRTATCGDPRDHESSPDPDHEEPIPFGARDKLDERSFGVIVDGDSMTARDIHPLDVVWVNPNAPARTNRVVLARVWDLDDDEVGMVVKVLGYRPGTADLALFSDSLGPDYRPLGLELYDRAAQLEVIGPVVWVTSGRPPGAPHSVSEIRPGHVPTLPPRATGIR